MELPGLSPMSPDITLSPVLVTVEPTKIAFLDAVPKIAEEALQRVQFGGCG